jgi:hypothetical protein
MGQLPADNGSYEGFQLLAELCAEIVVGQLALDSWLEYSDVVQICLTDREPALLASFVPGSGMFSCEDWHQ